MSWKGLAGFSLSGLMFSLPGALLPVWRHHLREDYMTVGNLFLAMNLGIVAGLALSRLLRGRSLALLLALACGLACAAFVFLAMEPIGSDTVWQMGGLLLLGCGAGLLNVGVFRAISPLYRHDPAATVNLAGAMFGAGCLLVAVLVAGTYAAYSVTTILILLALVPGIFLPIYARTRFAPEPPERQPSIRQAFADFKSAGAVLFALLLFFQFGNEWSIAGWLPLFLIHRLGMSPEAALFMLALYWLALLASRVVVFAILPAVSSNRVLAWSVIAALFGCMILTSTNNRFGAVAGILLVGGGFASIYPLIVERIGGRFPYYHPGFFNGIFSFALTGGMLAPWSLGLFTSLWGVRVAMALPLLGTIMVCVLLTLLWAETKLNLQRSPLDHS